MSPTAQAIDTEKCPYCDQSVVIVHSSEIYGEGHDYGLMKKCCDFPQCDSYSGYGATLANRELRELRKKCHRLFDDSWKSGRMSRGKAYAWLQKTMHMTAEQAHISKFRDKECQRLLAMFTQ